MTTVWLFCLDSTHQNVQIKICITCRDLVSRHFEPCQNNHRKLSIQPSHHCVSTKKPSNAATSKTDVSDIVWKRNKQSISCTVCFLLGTKCIFRSTVNSKNPSGLFKLHLHLDSLDFFLFYLLRVCQRFTATLTTIL